MKIMSISARALLSGLMMLPSLTSAFQVSLDCEPCIERSNKVVKAIYHGDVDDQFWTPIEMAATQAGRDFGVDFESTLFEDYSPTAMAAEIRAATANGVDALIVTIPTSEVQEAVAEAVNAGIPVFGLNSGYKVADEIGVSLMVAQDEYLAGERAANRFLEAMGNKSIEKAVFVNHEQGNSGLQDRFEGFRDRLHQENPNTLVTELFIDVDAPNGEAAKRLTEEISSCTADIILNGGQLSGMYTLQVIEDSEAKCVSEGSSKKAIIGTFDSSEEIYDGIASGALLFGISQQPHLQAVLPVMFASQYVTTGKLPAKPLGDEYGTFLSGPQIIDATNVPSAMYQKCAQSGFPDLACLDRPKIRIGGVLHGVTTDEFWDIVFAAAKQAAIDMHVTLELQRLEPPAEGQSDVVLHQKMADEIISLCDSDVDGLFVSIPSETVAVAVQHCLSLNVPVISVNSGAHYSDNLDLLHHVGQLEAVAGYEAGKKLIAEGATQGWCVNHEPENDTVGQRCTGMEMAFSEAPNVKYMGQIDVPRDDDAEYVSVVENTIGVDGTWEGIGLLLAGQIHAEPASDLIADHPEAAMGIFDISEGIFSSLDKDDLAFAIDQQPYLQGYLPVPLLVYNAYSKQHLVNDHIQSGPAFVTSSPTPNEVACEANLFEVCPLGSSNSNNSGGGSSFEPTEDMLVEEEIGNSPNVGLIVGLVVGSFVSIGVVVAIVTIVPNRAERRVSTISQPGRTVPKDGVPDADLEAPHQVPAEGSGVMMA